jgi:hypothetical protein
MRLFDTPGADSAYDRWLTTTPADRAHQDECNCEKCHDWHREEHLIEDNALDSPKDFQCCVEEYEARLEDGEYCKKHRGAYVEAPTKTTPFYCEDCEAEKEAKP